VVGSTTALVIIWDLDDLWGHKTLDSYKEPLKNNSGHLAWQEQITSENRFFSNKPIKATGNSLVAF
jgi:hypothetical protein